MTIEEIRKGAPSGSMGYVIGRISGKPIYINSQGLVWCDQYQEWTSFTHNMDIKPLF